jgi:hypothetical protein
MNRIETIWVSVVLDAWPPANIPYKKKEEKEGINKKNTTIYLLKNT